MIRCIKLRTGEEIIGVVDSECDEYVTLDEPCIITHGYTGEGLYGLKLAEFMIDYIKDDFISFERKDIMIDTEPNLVMTTFYSKYAEKSRAQRRDKNKPEEDIILH